MAETKVKAKDVITVYGTGTGKHMAKDQPYEVHKILAENLVKKGVATKTKPKKEKE